MARSDRLSCFCGLYLSLNSRLDGGDNESLFGFDMVIKFYDRFNAVNTYIHSSKEKDT